MKGDRWNTKKNSQLALSSAFASPPRRHQLCSPHPKPQPHYGMPSTCNPRCNASWWRREKKKRGRCWNKSVCGRLLRAKWEVCLSKLETLWTVFSSWSSRTNERLFTYQWVATYSWFQPDECELLFHFGAPAELMLSYWKQWVCFCWKSVCCVSRLLQRFMEMLQDFYFSPEAQQKWLSLTRNNNNDKEMWFTHHSHPHTITLEWLTG